MTSIEWLIDQMLKQGYFDSNKSLTYTNLDHLQQQAKEMHKQEIIDAYDKGEFDCGCNGTGEDYYNKTFKNQQ